jgi:WD40 repeat protein
MNMFMAQRSLSIILVTLLLLAMVPATSVQAQEFDPETLGLLWENKDGHNATLWNVRWSPDGKMISGAFFDETVTVFDAGTGDIIVKLGPHGTNPSSRCYGGKDCTIEDHLPVRVTAWSPDGAYLATGGDKVVINIYHTSNWTVHKVLSGHKGSIQSMAWSPDGAYLLSGSGTDKVDMHNMPENEIWVWNTTTWLKEAVMKGHQDGVLDVRFSPNGTRVASSSDDKTIRIWVAGTWEEEKVLRGHTLGVLDVAWSPDGKGLLSGSRDYKVRAWDYDTGESTDRYTEANCVRSVDHHPNGKIFANSGVDEVQLKIRDVKTGSVLKSFTDGAASKSDIMSSRWSPDGYYLASGAGKEHALRVYSFGKAPSNGNGGLELLTILPGMIIFFIAIAVAVVVFYYPLGKKVKEGGR